MNSYSRRSLLSGAALSMLASCSRESNEAGSDITLALSTEDADLKSWLQTTAKDALQEKDGLNLRLASFTQKGEIISKLLTDKRSGNAHGSIDLLTTSGEQFRTCRQAGLLYGPFTQAVPNVGFFPDTGRTRDFGTSIDGYEAPWQRRQLVFAYDPKRLSNPPKAGFEAIKAWLSANAGRFTWPAPPDPVGTAFITQVLIQIGGNADLSRFDPGVYERTSKQALAWLRGIRPLLWRRGETYPTTAQELDRLFLDGAVDLTMSTLPSFASLRIDKGEFLSTVRTFVFDSGTLANFMYLAIPFNAPNPGGAVLAVNYLLSLDSLLELSRTIGSPLPVDRSRLTITEKARTDALPRGSATLSPADLDQHAVPAPDVEYAVRIVRDWQKAQTVQTKRTGA